MKWYKPILCPSTNFGRTCNPGTRISFFHFSQIYFVRPFWTQIVPIKMSMVKGLLATVAKQYQGIVRTRVAAMGLKYEDLLIESDDVEKAINRIPSAVKIER